MPDHRFNTSTPPPQQQQHHHHHQPLRSDAPSSPGARDPHCVYESKDIFSQPPTTLIVRAGGAPHGDGSGGAAADGTCFYVDEVAIEPTAGWAQRFAKHQQMTVCFNHSYGKCTGRTGGDPSTCQQLHVRRATLEALRPRYVHPSRQYMSRTVKATIPMDVKQWLYAATHGKSGAMQYFEFLTADVDDTEGLRAFERAFRHWLMGPNAGPAAVASPSSSPSSNSTGSPRVMSLPFRADNVELCSSFCFSQQCPLGTACPYIHAKLASAMTRDPLIAQALEYLTLHPFTPAVLVPCAAVVPARVAMLRQAPRAVVRPAAPTTHQQQAPAFFSKARPPVDDVDIVSLRSLLQRVAALEPCSPLADYAPSLSFSGCGA